MVFSSTIFLLLFFPSILILYNLPIFKKNNLKYKNIILLLASLFFYAWGEPVFVFLMVLSIIFNWYIAIKMETSTVNKKKWMIGAIVFDITLIFIFKYLTFIIKNLNIVLTSLNLPQPEIALPIGISFFTFQIMSYIWDVYYGKAKIQRNISDLALYISMFPQLIAGPIVRYETIAHEITSRIHTINDFSKGIERFIIGLGKKVLLANTMAIIADQAFNLPCNNLSLLFSWVGIIAYSFQIFFDFSGYSDMAIGLGLMFGFHFDENFNYPYIANSITDFWRRWHISLSTWFKDYVYIPLGGSRVKKSKLIFNLFAVWILTGIWHGANWTFLIWGFIYFLLLTLEKITQFNKHFKMFGHVYTLFFVIIGWVFFRSESLLNAKSYLYTMFNLSNTPAFDNQDIHYLSSYFVFYILAILFSTPVMKPIIKYMKHHTLWNILYSLCVVFIFVLSLASIINSNYNPFIYFNF